MKLKYFIGILVLLLVMVGTASAQSFFLTNANEPYFQGKIQIRVDPDELNGKIAVQYESDGVDEVPIGIDMIFYNLDKDNGYQVTKVMEGDVETTGYWTLNFDGDVAAEGGDWGHFSSHKNLGPADSGGITEPIIFTLSSAFPDGIPANLQGHRVAVHIRFSNGKSTWVTDGNGAEIPEFPSIALPIAAVMGIMFIMGSRKKE